MTVNPPAGVNVASPVAEIVATDVSEDDHEASDVTSSPVPSVYFALAINFIFRPSPEAGAMKIRATAGVVDVEDGAAGE
jgi:hypothetical protein